MEIGIEARQKLGAITWVEDLHLPVINGPYRHQIMICCSGLGRQKTRFANGEYPYFAYFRVVNDKGEWGGQGAHIVPVLPDGRILMVVEQRPALGLFTDMPKNLYLDSRTINLDIFGPYSSVEFPGGGIEPGESVKIGALRELQEETEVNEQKVLLYRRIPPCYQFGSDFAGRNFFAIAYLSSDSFAEKVKNDGGLHVLALTRNEIIRNMRSGAITSGQAVISPWLFYEEVRAAKMDPEYKKELVREMYLVIEEIRLD